MRPHFFLLLALLVHPLPAGAQQVEKVRAGTANAPGLPEDLFNLPPGTWVFAKQLWRGNEACTHDQCEAGYTFENLVVSVERSKKFLRIVAGFRDCGSVAWHEYDVGDKVSNQESKTIGKRVKKTVGTSAKYCRVAAPAIAALDARLLYPSSPPAQ